MEQSTRFSELTKAMLEELRNRIEKVLIKFKNSEELFNFLWTKSDGTLQGFLISNYYRNESQDLPMKIENMCNYIIDETVCTMDRTIKSDVIEPEDLLEVLKVDQELKGFLCVFFEPENLK